MGLPPVRPAAITKAGGVVKLRVTLEPKSANLSACLLIETSVKLRVAQAGPQGPRA